MTTVPLYNLNILVTRPTERAAILADLLDQAGANAVLYPVITIADCDDTERIQAQLQNLSKYDLAIFISPAAVSKTLTLIHQFPENLKVAAIGSSTCQVLIKHHIQVDIKPDGHSSEALLEHPALQTEHIHNKNIIILRGQGGREYLAETLRQRGANITYAEVYQRIIPPGLSSLSSDQLNQLDILMITSNEGLQNLFELTEDKTTLKQIPLLVPGERAAKLATKLGFSEIIVSDNATDAATIKALIKWKKDNS